MGEGELMERGWFESLLSWLIFRPILGLVETQEVWYKCPIDMIALIATSIHHLDPVILDIPGTPLSLRWYGLAYVAGFVLGYWVLLQLSKKKLYCVSPDKLADFITVVCLVGVIIGGRLGEFFFYWLPAHGLSGLMADPLWVFRVWEGGMASHGGILAVLITAIIYARKQHLSIPAVCDGLAIVCPIGLFFGRVANFINGELYGRICAADSVLAMKFPQEFLSFSAEQRGAILQALSSQPGSPLAEPSSGGLFFEDILRLVRENDAFRNGLGEYLNPRYPSQLFEAFGEGLLIFVILIILRLTWRHAPAGIFSALFCFLYAAARIFTECFREPDAPLWGSITRGQYLSFAVIALGCIFLVFSYRSAKHLQPK